jgi:hypothetical protein
MQTGNFPLKAFIGIIMTLLKKMRWGNLRNMIIKRIRESVSHSTT